LNDIPSGAEGPDSLSTLGWSDRWAALLGEIEGDELYPGRVMRADRGSVLVATLNGVERAEPSATLRKAALPAIPVTGDWLALRRPDGHDLAIIEAVLPRASAFTRGDPGATSAAQVLSANIDVVFVVNPLDTGPNLRRIERELALAWKSGAVPVVVLTKADLSPDAEKALADVESVALGVDVVLTSAARCEGIDAIAEHASAGKTVALIGPSGAGKSTLVNALLGEERQATREVRVGDGKGRHTTVTRELIPLPGGGVLIDTPGMRAVAVHELDAGLDAAFPDIAALAPACRFRDCGHTDEPGCAVVEAVQNGSLPEARLLSYHKLQREAVVAAMKTDARLRNEEVRKWKMIHKSMRDHYKKNGRYGL
jgi:ribosome biogenesis GTPase